AEFPIPSVGREAGGNYTCDYHSIAEPNRWSGLSDPVEIIVTASPDFTRANIARLALGAVVLLVLGLILAEAYYSRPRGGTLGEVTPPSVPLAPPQDWPEGDMGPSNLLSLCTPMSLDPAVQGRESP
ncbi:T cell-interacting, activating receptor on myeloid cells 1, partial [Chelydra serpentina]